MTPYYTPFETWLEVLERTGHEYELANPPYRELRFEI